jgi:hypothetical protein
MAADLQIEAAAVGVSSIGPPSVEQLEPLPVLLFPRSVGEP